MNRNAKSNKNKARRGKRQFNMSESLRPDDIMPPFKNVYVNFIDPNPQVNAPAASFVVKSLRVNDLYDPDPAILTTGVAGFNELMKFYEFYRVNEVGVRWEVANNEVFPVSAGFVFSQINLSSTITTRNDAFDALENGIGTKARMLQRNTGGPARIIQRSLRLKNLLGNPTLYNGSENYLGTVTTSPLDALWVNLIVVSPAGNLTNGIIGSLTLRFYARLFGRTVLKDTNLFRHDPLPTVDSTEQELTSYLQALKLRTQQFATPPAK